MVQALQKTISWFLGKLNIKLLHDSAIPQLGIYTEELKARDLNKYVYTVVSLQYYSR